jgi:hypothetical protein
MEGFELKNANFHGFFQIFFLDKHIPDHVCWAEFWIIDVNITIIVPSLQMKDEKSSLSVILWSNHHGYQECCLDKFSCKYHTDKQTTWLEAFSACITLFMCKFILKGMYLPVKFLTMGIKKLFRYHSNQRLFFKFWSIIQLIGKKNGCTSLLTQ